MYGGRLVLIKKFESYLTLLNELSTALVLAVFAVLLLGKHVIGGSETVVISVESPVLSEQEIGRFVDDFGDEHIVSLQTPVIDGDTPTFTVTEKSFKGYGTPRVVVDEVELTIPELDSPAYRLVKKGDDATATPNVVYRGTGFFYKDKSVTFDGSGEASQIRTVLEMSLGVLAVILLLLRILLWVVRPSVEENTPKKQDDQDEVVGCIGCSEVTTKKRSILSVEGRGLICTRCVIKYLDERAQSSRGESILKSIERWKSGNTIVE